MKGSILVIRENNGDLNWEIEVHGPWPGDFVAAYIRGGYVPHGYKTRKAAIEAAKQFAKEIGMRVSYTVTQTIVEI